MWAPNLSHFATELWNFCASGRPILARNCCVIGHWVGKWTDDEPKEMIMSKLKKQPPKTTEIEVFKGFPNVVVLHDDPKQAEAMAAAIRKIMSADKKSTRNSE
jgi:hypothetical protein